MAANTTKNEATEAQKEQEVVVADKKVTNNEVVSLYNEGKNLYQIAEEVFGFQSEEAVERVRQIVGCQ